MKTIEKATIERAMAENPGKTQKELAAILGIPFYNLRKALREYNIQWVGFQRNNHLKYRDYFLENHEKKSVFQMANELRLPWNIAYDYLLDNRLARNTDIYVLYEKDEYIAEGTLYELSDISGKKPSTLLWYSYVKSRRYSTEIFRVEGDDLDEITG